MERVDTPWGGHLTFAKNEKVTVKILKVATGCEIPLQSHRLRDEDWYVLKGKVMLQYGQTPKVLDNIVLGMGGGVTIARGMLHRAKAVEDTLIIEVARGHSSEEDAVFYDMKRGRK